MNFAYTKKYIDSITHDGIKRLRKGQIKPDPLLKHEFHQLIDTAPQKQKNLW